MSPYDDAWPGTVELELLAEIQLNDPRTRSLRAPERQSGVSDGQQQPEATRRSRAE